MMELWIKAILLSTVAISYVKSKSNVTEEICELVVDIGFLLDSSDSVRYDYTNEKFFLKKIITKFGISKKGSHAGVVVFSSQGFVNTEIKLNDHFSVESFTEAVDAVPFYGFMTRIDLALREAHNTLFSERHGARRGVKKLMFLITDGRQNPDHWFGRKLSPTFEAQPLHDSHVQLYAIGVGDRVNRTELEQITRSENKVYTVDNFEELLDDNFVNLVALKSCIEIIKLPDVPNEEAGLKASRNSRRNTTKDFEGRVTGDGGADAINSVYGEAKSGDGGPEGDGKEKKGGDGSSGSKGDNGGDGTTGSDGANGGDGTKIDGGSKGGKGVKGGDLTVGGDGSKAGNGSSVSTGTEGGDGSKNGEGTVNGNGEKGDKGTEDGDSKKDGDDKEKIDEKEGGNKVKNGDKDGDGASAGSRKNGAGGAGLGEEYGKGQNGGDKEETGNRNHEKCREENENKQAGNGKCCCQEQPVYVNVFNGGENYLVQDSSPTKRQSSDSCPSALHQNSNVNLKEKLSSEVTNLLKSLKCISSINGDALKIIKKAIELSEGKSELKKEGLNILNKK